MAVTARFTTVTELLTQREAWQRLADEAIEPNPFYGPDYLVASETHLHPRTPIRMLAVERDGLLTGLFPLERPILSDMLLGRAWRLYRNPYTCLGTPLIGPVSPAETLAEALAFITKATGPNLLILPMLPSDGPIAGLVQAYSAASGHSARHALVHERASIRSTLPPEVYRQTHWSKSRRSKMKRLLARCQAEGSIGTEFVLAGDPRFAAMLDAFLALEASGWKGRMGTALACRPTTEAFARAAFASTGAGSKSGFIALMLNGAPIAMEYLLITGRTAFTVKVAYDEAFEKLSPGQMLDSETLAFVGANAPFDEVDSCALPGHPLEAIWAERVSICTAILGLSPQTYPRGTHLAGWWLETLQHIRKLRHRQSFTGKPA